MNQRWILTSMAVLTAMSMIGTALSPFLLNENPLLLLALNPDGRHLLLSAPFVNLFDGTIVVAIRRGLSMLATFAVASLYGARVLGWLRDKGRWASRLVDLTELAYERTGLWLVLLIPSFAVAGFVGASGLSFRRFFWAMIPGQFVYALFMFRFGEALASYTRPVMVCLAAHPGPLTAIATALVIGGFLLNRRTTSPAEPSHSYSWGDGENG